MDQFEKHFATLLIVGLVAAVTAFDGFVSWRWGFANIPGEGYLDLAITNSLAVGGLAAVATWGHLKK
jgi:hypothetical protein